MNKNRLLLQSLQPAFVIGGVLAMYISLTTFRQMPHNLWLSIHNLLVVTLLVLAAFTCYKYRRTRISFKFTLLSIALYFSVIAFLYSAVTS